MEDEMSITWQQHIRWAAMRAIQRALKGDTLYACVGFAVDVAKHPALADALPWSARLTERYNKGGAFAMIADCKALIEAIDHEAFDRRFLDSWISDRKPMTG